MIADTVLAILCPHWSEFQDPNFSILDYDAKGFDFDRLKGEIPTVEFQDLEGALDLLETNGHVFKDDVKDINPYEPPEYYFPTLKGREAFLEGYYDRENRKDKLEQFELATRWILPFISMVVALSALIWQIWDHLHPKK